MPRKTPSPRRPRPRRGRFNEAAARCRGKQMPPGVQPPFPSRFNEAAARCRGKRDRAAAGMGDRAAAASMRPRPDAAENLVICTRGYEPTAPLQ